jgi:myosin-5
LSTQVTYDTTGFLEKNRDLLHLDSIQLLSSCSCHLPQIFASSMLTQSEKSVVGPSYKSGGADSQKLSVATKFKVNYFPVVGIPKLDLEFDICNNIDNMCILSIL